MKTWLSIIGIIGLVSAVAEAGITKSVTLQNGFTVNYATIEVLALDKDRDEAVIGVNVWKDQATFPRFKLTTSTEHEFRNQDEHNISCCRTRYNQNRVQLTFNLRN